MIEEVDSHRVWYPGPSPRVARTIQAPDTTKETEVKKPVAALGLAAILTAGSVTAESPVAGMIKKDAAAPETTTTEAPAAVPAEAAEAAKAEENVLTVWGVRVGNPIDPSTWWDAHPAGGHDDMVRINPADPRFWMAFVDPERHSAMHATMLNPATMGQFFQLETYTNMLDFGTWMSWMDASNYAPLVKAQTWAYWMQPGAYAHLIDPDMYTMMFDVDKYAEVLDVAADTMGIKFN